MRSALTTARYAASPVGVALSSSPVTAFLQRTLHNVCANDKIHVEHLTGRKCDAQPARNDRVRLYNACSEADARTRGRTGKTMEHRVVVCAMNLVVWHAVVAQLTLYVWEPVHVFNALAGVILSKDNHGEIDSMYTERGAQAPVDKKPCCVGRHTRTSFTQLACRLKQCDAVPNTSTYGLWRGHRCLHQL